MNNIKQPTHYMSNGEETIVKIVRELGIEKAIVFCKGNVIKYADRSDYKGQKESDLKKIQEYTNMENDLEKIKKKVEKDYFNNEIILKDFSSRVVAYTKRWSENGHSLKGIIDE